ncbi:cell division protein FtsA [Spiroplasma corruscae]|uniref:Cell division protein FtsA n=1 Tax=Spiroplasma corruscae TaxID=216934 RepID=A0A222END8_9MOLU|nr:hypothetical protein [Spiroplasma corruscae]ASP28010.1 cell division protein FtsA [Spiroplasma corruscae]
MFKEVYAVLEVQRDEIKFAVGIFRDNRGLKVVYKERVKGTWLTDEDEIIDINRVSQKLRKAINSYNANFKDKLVRISVVLPSKTLQIKDVSSHIIVNFPNIVTHEHIRLLHSEANKINFDKRNVMINIKPYNFIIDNQFEFGITPINAPNVHSITMLAKIYTVNQKVYKSFKEVIKQSDIDSLLITSDMFSIARQINSEASFKENFITINWGKNQTDIGYFCKETLVKKETVSFGIKDIISNIATKLNCKNDVAEKYIFKLLDFSSNDQNESIIYRKYISKDKLLSELTASQIKNLVIEELNWIVDKTDACIENELKESIHGFKILHVGKMTEIAGFEKILQRSKFKNNASVYYSLVTGASEIWLTSICGMIKMVRIYNKNSDKLITSNLEIDKSQIMQPLNNQNLNINNQFNRGIVNPRILKQVQRNYVQRNHNNIGSKTQNNGLHFQRNMQNNANFSHFNANLGQNNHSWQNNNQVDKSYGYQNNGVPINNEFMNDKTKNR